MLLLGLTPQQGLLILLENEDMLDFHSVRQRIQDIKGIILDFEAILGELYFHCYGKEPHTIGFTERAAYFDGLPSVFV